MCVAVLDIGSNTSKVLVADLDSLGNLVQIDQKSITCRLGSGLSSGKLLMPKSTMEEGIIALDQLLAFASSFKPKRIRVVATEAIRKFENAYLFTEKIKQLYNLEISVLSGLEEATLIAKGLMCDPSLTSVQDFNAFDLGGGSLELISVSDRKCTGCNSLPLGVVRLAEKFSDNLTGKLKGKSILDIQEEVAQKISSDSSFILANRSVGLVGVGGSVIFLRQILRSNKLIKKDSERLKFSEIQKVSKIINSMDLAKRISSFPEVPADRADVFPTALLIILEVMKKLETETLIHSFYNLRHGLANELLLKN